MQRKDGRQAVRGQAAQYVQHRPGVAERGRLVQRGQHVPTAGEAEAFQDRRVRAGVVVGEVALGHGIADEVDVPVGHPLTVQRGHGLGGGRQVVVGARGDDAAVGFLGRAVGRAQARLQMDHRGAPARGDKRGGEGGVHVTDHHHRLCGVLVEVTLHQGAEPAELLGVAGGVAAPQPPVHPQREFLADPPPQAWVEVLASVHV